MLNYYDLLIHQARYQELLREFEEGRRLRRALARGERPDGLHCRALIWLGGRLVAWGQGLQERYGATAVAPHISNHTSQLASR
jgi:hypothetical protein